MKAFDKFNKMYEEKINEVGDYSLQLRSENVSSSFTNMKKLFIHRDAEGDSSLLGEDIKHMDFPYTKIKFPFPFTKRI